jgi:UDPglucose 6-dehydrogenase
MYPSFIGDSQEADTNWSSWSHKDSNSTWVGIIKPKIGIVGYGVVGKAVAEGFESRGLKVLINDIENNVPFPYSKQGLMTECDFIFICVNTPYREGKTDLGNVYTAIEELAMYHNEFSADPIIIIKSTVIPGTTDDMQKLYPKMTFTVNPEFLRERTPLEDFLNPDRVVIGAYDPEIAFLLVDLYQHIVSRRKIEILTPKECELVKYLSNAFLTLKVAFSQAVNEMCILMGINADHVMDIVTKDRRINPSHMRPSLGQMNPESLCLPKDLLSFKDFLKDMGMDSRFFEEIYVLAVNNDQSSE